MTVDSKVDPREAIEAEELSEAIEGEVEEGAKAEGEDRAGEQGGEDDRPETLKLRQEVEDLKRQLGQTADVVQRLSPEQREMLWRNYVATYLLPPGCGWMAPAMGRA